MDNKQWLKTKAMKLCDGCNVRGNWEHRCHGKDCDCDNPICMERQGKITHDELMAIVKHHLPSKGDDKYCVCKIQKPMARNLDDTINCIECRKQIEPPQKSDELVEWISVKDRLPEYNETVWACNEKDGYVNLACIVNPDNDGWLWAVTNGIIYSEDGKIVSECELDDDYDFTHWMPLPEIKQALKQKGDSDE